MSGLDADFAELVTRCLARQASDRPQSADEVVFQLERIAAGAPPIPEGSPYRGLSPFEAEQRALFFGRGPEISAIVDRLRGASLVVVTGDSGIGKSSLCRAGVLPAVAAGALEVGGSSRRWQTRVISPGPRPASALLAALGLAESAEPSAQADPADPAAPTDPAAPAAPAPNVAPESPVVQVHYIVESAHPGARSLRSILEDGPIPDDEARRIAGEVATALSEAARLGIHHGSLGLRSVLITPTGDVVVQGLATEAALQGLDDTAPHVPATDARAIMGILYAALTTRWPLGPTGGTAPSLRVGSTLTPPSEVVPGVPAEIDAAVVEVCLLYTSDAADE